MVSSVGRRLVIIVLGVTIALIVAVVLLTVNATSGALREVIVNSLVNRSQAVSNALDAQLQSAATLGDTLAGEIAARRSWTPSELRDLVIRTFGPSGRLNVGAVNIYRPTQDTLYTYEYSGQDATALGPLVRVRSVDRLPADAWVRAVLTDGQRRWHGPADPLLALNTGPVVSVAVPQVAGGSAASVVWLDIPVSTLQTTLADFLTAEAELEQGYVVLVNAAAQPLATFNVPETAPLTDLPLLLNTIDPTTPTTRLIDPLNTGVFSLAIRQTLPVNGWQVVEVVPENFVARAIPAEPVVTVLVVSVIGLILLSWVVQTYINRAVSVPLMSLSTAAQEIGSGDMRYAITGQQRGDEIGRMAQALDDMKLNLARSYEELARWNRSLDERVRQRTAEAEAARREAQANAEELRAVYDESLAVVTAYELEIILGTLMRRLVSLLRGSSCAGWLLSEDGDRLRLVANTASGDGALNTTVSRADGLVGEAVTRGDLIVVDDYERYPRRLGIGLANHMQRAMCVPLLFSGQPIGAVIVGRRRDDAPFNPQDQRTLRLFANLVSPAVRNAQLFVQRDAAVQEAERANQVKTRFLASVTHELRTPLNLIINNMDFMRIGAFGEVNAEQVDRLDQTTRSAEHLLYLINDLLDISKIEAGEMQLFVQPTDIYTLLDDVLDNARVLMEGKRDAVALYASIPEDLPTVPMDARRVRQVLMNLLSNAIKFTAAGSVRLDVRLHGDMLRFSVADTGMGVPPDEVGRLFEAFERTSKAKHQGIEGTGLGLPISKFLVEAHGGDLIYRSGTDGGSVFSFTVPLEAPSPVYETQTHLALTRRPTDPTGEPA